MGATLPSMARSSPPRRASMVPAGTATTWFSRSTRAAGISTSPRVSSFTMTKTVGSALPRASSAVHPVSRSAAVFMNVMRPARSVTMTASPMLASVTAISSRCSRTRFSARRRPAASALMAPATSTKIRTRTRSSAYGGSKKAKCPTTATPVARTPGPRPPYQALTTTAARSRKSCDRSASGTVR